MKLGSTDAVRKQRKQAQWKDWYLNHIYRVGRNKARINKQQSLRLVRIG